MQQRQHLLNVTLLCEFSNEDEVWKFFYNIPPVEQIYASEIPKLGIT